ncbi:amp-CoA ligase, partial [Imleria badia]
PPLDGSLFFPDLIDFHMCYNPSLPVWIFADNQSTKEVTFLEFGRAAHKVAHALRPRHTGHGGQVVIPITIIDAILHQAVVAGMSIAGLVPFPVSPRNSAATIINMMRRVRCSRIVTPSDAHHGLIDAIREESSDLAFSVKEVPSVSYALPKFTRETKRFLPYPHFMLRPDPDSPVICIHSSGSTEFPKPIPQATKLRSAGCIAVHRCVFFFPLINWQSYPHTS